MRYVMTILCSMFLSIGCGSPDLITLPSLSGQVPEIIGVLPKDESTVKPSSIVVATFTKKVDQESLNKATFPVIENYSDRTIKVLQDELEDGELVGMEGDYNVTEDGFSVIFRPTNGLVDGLTYAVVITDKILTVDGFSLSDIYVSKFKVDSSSLENIDENSDVSGNISSEELGQDDDTEEVEEGSGEDETEASASLVINEVLYDSSGSDSVGDLFIELKAVVGGSVAGYKVLFINGDGGNITASISVPGGAKVADNGFYLIADDIQGQAGVSLVESADMVANFDPHNGPDAVQLLNAKGELMDAVCYGNVTGDKAENGLSMCEGSPAPDAPGGKSISRKAGEADSNDNSVDFIVNETPTPGN